VLERKAAAGSSCGERANRASKAAPTYTFKANHAEAGLTFDSISIYIWRAESLIIIKQFINWPPDSDPTVSKDLFFVSACSVLSDACLVGLQVNNYPSVQQLPYRRLSFHIKK
jgi:hypothetical protein